MSTQIKKEIICPKCGTGFKIIMTTGINNSQDTEFKEKILMETLFDWRCPECNYGAQMVYPLVFHDPKSSYIVALTPIAGKASSIQSTAQLEGTIKRRVKSLAELKEKILIFDSGLNDVAIELVKDALCSIIKSSYKTNKVKTYFSKICDDNSLEFAIFMGGKKEPLYKSTKAAVYSQSIELLNAIEYQDANKFLRVGPTMAARLLEEYKNL